MSEYTVLNYISIAGISVILFVFFVLFLICIYDIVRRCREPEEGDLNQPLNRIYPERIGHEVAEYLP